MNKLMYVLIRYLFISRPTENNAHIKIYNNISRKYVPVEFRPFLDEFLNQFMNEQMMLGIAITMFLADPDVYTELDKIHKDILNFKVTVNYIIELIKIMFNNVPSYISKYNRDNKNYMPYFNYYGEFNLLINDRFNLDDLLMFIGSFIDEDVVTFEDLAESIQLNINTYMKDEYHDIFGEGGLFEDLEPIYEIRSFNIDNVEYTKLSNDDIVSRYYLEQNRYYDSFMETWFTEYITNYNN